MGTQPPSEDATQQYNPQPAGQQPGGGARNPWPWILGAIAIIAAGVIAAILITGSGDSSNTDSVTTQATLTKTSTKTSTPTTTATTTATTTTAPINISRTCNVAGVPNVAGNSTVANVNATNVPSSQTALASCAQATAVVRGVARQQAEMPVTVQGFNCTPTVSGNYANFVCTLHGADSALQINTKFKLSYTGN